MSVSLALPYVIAYVCIRRWLPALEESADPGEEAAPRLRRLWRRTVLAAGRRNGAGPRGRRLLGLLGLGPWRLGRRRGDRRRPDLARSFRVGLGRRRLGTAGRRPWRIARDPHAPEPVRVRRRRLAAAGLGRQRPGRWRRRGRPRRLGRLRRAGGRSARRARELRLRRPQRLRAGPATRPPGPP